jgi:hypothetical protein
VRAQTDAARAQESGARTMLGYTRLRCALRRRGDGADGRSGNDGRAGRAVAPGGSGRSACNLQTTVDESAIGAIHKGMKVQVTIDARIIR